MDHSRWVRAIAPLLFHSLVRCSSLICWPRAMAIDWMCLCFPLHLSFVPVGLLLYWRPHWQSTLATNAMQC